MNLFRHIGVGLLAGGCVGILALGGHVFADPRARDTPDFVRRQPMIFFVAKGDPGACGQDCSEWIAAEGAFDPGAHSRLRQFLDALPRKDLPIFFHSNGGLVGSSIAVGLVLREWRMKAGVGHTLPVGCRDTLNADEACRRLMQSGQDFKSRLRESGAVCASSCVYALIGASTRNVAYVARVGVHEHRAWRLDKEAGLWTDISETANRATIIDRLKQYATQMGVDFGLVEIAERTKSASMHWLSRADIARFGIATSGFFETPWLAYTRPGFGYFVAKSITQPSRLNPAEYRTTTVEFGCSFILGNASISVRRELDAIEALNGTAVRVTAGETIVLDSARRGGPSVDVRATSVATRLIAQAAASDSLLLEERSGTWSRATKFSTQGLSDALKLAPEDCREKI